MSGGVKNVTEQEEYRFLGVRAHRYLLIFCLVVVVGLMQKCLTQPSLSLSAFRLLSQKPTRDYDEELFKTRFRTQRWKQMMVLRLIYSIRFSSRGNHLTTRGIKPCLVGFPFWLIARPQMFQFCASKMRELTQNIKKLLILRTFSSTCTCFVTMIFIMMTWWWWWCVLPPALVL